LRLSPAAELAIDTAAANPQHRIMMIVISGAVYDSPARVE